MGCDVCADYGVVGVMKELSKHQKALLRNVIKEIEKHRDGIGKHRDALRDLQSEIEDLLEPTEQGLLSLDDAISSLSEHA